MASSPAGTPAESLVRCADSRHAASLPGHVVLGAYRQGVNDLAGPVALALVGLWVAYLVPHKLRHRQQQETVIIVEFGVGGVVGIGEILLIRVQRNIQRLRGFVGVACSCPLRR